MFHFIVSFLHGFWWNVCSNSWFWPSVGEVVVSLPLDSSKSFLFHWFSPVWIWHDYLCVDFLVFILRNVLWNSGTVIWYLLLILVSSSPSLFKCSIPSPLSEDVLITHGLHLLKLCCHSWMLCLSPSAF